MYLLKAVRGINRMGDLVQYDKPKDQMHPRTNTHPHSARVPSRWKKLPNLEPLPCSSGQEIEEFKEKKKKRQEAGAGSNLQAKRAFLMS